MRMLKQNVWGTCTLVLAAIGVGTPGNTLQANTEMAAIVRQFDLFVSEQIIASQASQLSAEFRRSFRTKSQLNQRAVADYFSSNPQEVMAFRAYMQQLINLGVLSGDDAESLVVTAFQTLEMAPKNQAIVRSSIVSSQTEDTESQSELSVFDFPSGVLGDGTVPTPTDKKTPSEPLDFGEKLEKEQKAAIAAEALENDIKERERIERNKKLARALVDEFSQGKPTPESLGKRVERVVTEFAETESRKQVESVLDNVEISVTSVRNGPEYAVRGLKAFDEVNPNYFSFTEFGMTSDDEDTTVNVGIGIRKLSKDQTIMGGINAFYDQEIDTNHKRGSIGVELVSAPFRFNANRYYALSDGKALNALQTEKPMSGHDVDVEVALPYLPGLFAGYNQSTWYGEDGVSDVERKAYRLRGNLSQNFSVEFGKRTYSGTIEGQETAKLSYNYVFGADSDDPKLLDIDTQPYRQRKVGPRERYRMVERENQIVTQVSQSDLQVTFTAL